MNQKDINIELKKVVLMGLQQSGYSLTNVIQELVNNFFEIENMVLPEKAMKEQVKDYVLAYLEMGYSYLEHYQLFDYVFENCGWKYDEILSLRKKNKRVIVNKEQIRLLLGKWPASKHNSHTIIEAIDDIMLKIERNSKGTYYYYSITKSGTYTAFCQLSIFDEYILFWDIIRNKYYHLVKKDNT